MPESITDEAWRFAWKHRPACLGAVTALLGLAIGVPLGLMSGDMIGGILSGYSLAGFLFLMVSTALWLHARGLAGPVVQDCGRRSGWIGWLALAAIGPISFFTCPEVGRTMFFSVFPDPVSDVLWALFWGTGTLYSFAEAMGRLQIHQNGISLYGIFVKWDGIVSYRWEEGKECSMAIQVKNRLSLFILVPQSFSVSSAQKNCVDQWLEMYFPTFSGQSWETRQV